MGDRTHARTGQRSRMAVLSASVLTLALALGGCSSFGKLAHTAGSPGSGHSSKSDDNLFGNYLAARAAGLDRDNQAAAEYYERALASDPDNVIILERAFLLDLSTGRMTKAIDLAKSLADRRPQTKMARLMLGVAAYKDGNQDKARTEYQEAIGGLYNQLIIALLDGWTYAAEGRKPEALKALTAFEAVAAASSIPGYHSALMYDLLGDAPAAEAAFVKVVERDGRDDFRVIETYGDFLERQGRRADAVAIYRAYLEGDPENPVIRARLANADAGKSNARPIASFDDGAAEAIFSISRLLAQEKAIDLPIIYLQMALYLSPDHMPAKMVLASLQERIEAYDEAERLYKAVPPTDPYWRSAQAGLAQIYEASGEKKKAIDILERLVKADANNVEAAVTLGDLYRAEKQFGAAVRVYSGAIDARKAAGDDTWFLYYARGIAYERAKAWGKAEADFFRALEIEPDQPLVLNYLAYSWIEQGIKYDEALRLLHLAAEARPTDGYIIDSLGWAYYRVGDYDKAVEHLERAVVLAPAESVVHDHLGDAYWRVGRRIEARFQWRHALTHKPEEDQVADIQRKLDRGLPDEAMKPVPPVAEPSGKAGPQSVAPRVGG